MAALVCSSCLTITKTVDTNIGKNAKCPKCGEYSKIVHHEDGADYSGLIILTSGTEIEFVAVYMVPLLLVQKVQDLYDQAVKKFTPKSSGLGFIGDIGFVAAASIATAAVENVANSLSANAGNLLLQQYSAQRLALRYSGKFCKVDSIRQIQLADPSLWASEQKENGVAVPYTMMDGDFICVKQKNDSPINIRWSSVEQFWVKLEGASI
jgi:hypothetical protein